MTVHFHGTPITPRAVLIELAGRNFCVRYGAHGDAQWCHTHGQSVMLDNGAFSFWRKGVSTDWNGYYAWAEPWLDHQTSWAVIPDIIDGGVEENDALIAQWPFGDRGSPVWHMHEPLERLLDLCDQWSRVCIGSSGEYAKLRTPAWHRRMEAVFDAVCGNGPPPIWLHMLRGMALSEGHYPFASVDSTDIARNHNRGGGASLGDRKSRAVQMAERWDSRQTPARWVVSDQQELVA